MSLFHRMLHTLICNLPFFPKLRGDHACGANGHRVHSPKRKSGSGMPGLVYKPSFTIAFLHQNRFLTGLSDEITSFPKIFMLCMNCSQWRAASSVRIMSTSMHSREVSTCSQLSKFLVLFVGEICHSFTELQSAYRTILTMGTIAIFEYSATTPVTPIFSVT